MNEPANILARAIAAYRPVKIILMVSGGHDSITNAHMCAAILMRWGFPFEVYHGDTTIGIPETQQYVKAICLEYDWNLNIRRPPNPEDWYENIVRQYGFPGHTKTAHRFMYIRLKERAIRNFVTHECKENPRGRQNVLLLTGIRKDESAIRMGYSDVMTKDDSRVWVSPIFHLTEADCKEYMFDNSIPTNPVKEKICISGECLCGSWAGDEEEHEIRHSYPHVGAELDRLTKIAEENGFPWRWGQGPNEWKVEQEAKKQLSFNFMCAGCERKHSIDDAA